MLELEGLKIVPETPFPENAPPLRLGTSETLLALMHYCGANPVNPALGFGLI